MHDRFVIGRAVGLIEAGKTFRWVADHLNVSVGVVHKWYAAFSELGTVRRRRASGRPRVSSDRDDCLLVRLARLDRFASVRKLRQLSGLGFSQSTIRRRVVASGLRRRRCAIKPFLSPESKAARYAWCQNRALWSQNRFNFIVWSDESRFRLFRNDGRLRVRRLPGERYHEGLVSSRVQGGGGSVHVWGSIWFGGRSSLQILDKGVNSEYYCQILSNFFDHDRLPQRWIFQQDNAPPHRSNETRRFLEARGIRPIDWPSKSPDLNPIEHVWDFLGQKLVLRNPINLRDISRILLEEWNRLPQDYIDNLILSMKRRVEAVIQANGRHTRY